MPDSSRCKWVQADTFKLNSRLACCLPLFAVGLFSWAIAMHKPPSLTITQL